MLSQRLMHTLTDNHWSTALYRSLKLSSFIKTLTLNMWPLLHCFSPPAQQGRCPFYQCKQQRTMNRCPADICIRQCMWQCETERRRELKVVNIIVWCAGTSLKSSVVYYVLCRPENWAINHPTWSGLYNHTLRIVEWQLETTSSTADFTQKKKRCFFRDPMTIIDHTSHLTRTS